MTSGTNLSLPKDPSAPESPKADLGRTTLHILTLTPYYPFAANPVYGSYVSETIAHFSGFNLQSTVVGVSPYHHARRWPIPSAPAAWLRYPQIPGNFGLTTAGRFLYHRLLLRVQELHRHNPIDMIHAHAALPCGHAASLLGDRLQIPFVVTIHGLDVFNACFDPGTAAAKRRANLSSEVYRRADSVICISRTIQNILKERSASQVSSCVIYNGTDAQLFSPSEGATTLDVPSLLVVGNLLRGKGHEVVLKAMAQVAPQFPDLRCTIIGEGPDHSRFADLARNLGIDHRVRFLGQQDRQAVAQAMRACTIFAMPSRFEGLGCAYLEAMACAKPVIACEGQGIAEIIRHGQNGWLIPIEATAEMADALRKLLASPDLRIRIGRNARQTILDGLTLTDQVRHLADLYREVVKRAVPKR
jgi:teichuronic acid biosynthesis glycosyltransferase TuaC